MKTWIAVAEPDSSDRKVLELLVSMQGFTSEAYENETDLLANVSSATCILLSHSFGKDGTTEIIASIRRAGIAVPIIVLTRQPSVAEVVRLLKSGANDVLEKPLSGPKLHESIETSIKELQARNSGNNLPDCLTEGLNDEESFILQALAEGKTIKEIARSLQVSIRTVHYRKANLLKHFEMENRKQLVQHVKTAIQANRRPWETEIPAPRMRVHGPMLPMRKPLTPSYAGESESQEMAESVFTSERRIPMPAPVESSEYVGSGYGVENQLM